MRDLFALGPCVESSEDIASKSRAGLFFRLSSVVEALQGSCDNLIINKPNNCGLRSSSLCAVARDLRGLACEG